jgi:hypothetical protein
MTREEARSVISALIEAPWHRTAINVYERDELVRALDMLATDAKLREMAEATQSDEVARLRKENYELNFHIEHLHAVEIDMEDAQKDITRLRELNDELVGALEAMLEVCDGPCRYDHHGLCQEHNLRRNEAGAPECQVELARAALAKAKGDDGEDPL